MTSRLILAVLLIGATCLTCHEAPLVVQGTVVRYDATDKTIVVSNDQPPNQELTIALSSADMGTEPKTGEIVRIAYRRTSQGPVGIRVMNLSHQIK